ncbi:sensor domain-containing diguanylate cyclase [Aliivibrio wodanis]|uniref:sensor domain-containing diguanylate cyclase n=1 Tax=Aliivibrio wodanis TaxID=80852 RepID=UPI00406C9A73
MSPQASTSRHELKIREKLDYSWLIMRQDTSKSLLVINSILNDNNVDQGLLAECKLHYAWCSLHDCDAPKAIEFFLESIRLNKLLNEREEIIRGLNGLGAAYSELSLYQSRINAFNQALEYSVNLNKPLLTVPVKLNILNLYLENAEFDLLHKELESFKKIIEKYDLIKQIADDNLSILYTYHAASTQEKGALSKASQLLEQAKQLAIQSKNLGAQFFIDQYIAKQLYLTGQIEASLKKHHDMLEAHNYDTMGVTYYCMVYQYSSILVDIGEVNKAISILSKLITGSPLKYAPYAIIKSHELLSHCYAETNNHTDAYLYLKKSNQLKKQMTELDGKQQMDLLQQNSKIESLSQQAHSEKTMRKKLERLHESMLLIERIGKNIASSLNMSEIVNMLFDAFDKHIGINNIAIGLFDENKELVFEHAIESGIKMNGFTLSLDEKNSHSVRCFIQQQTLVPKEHELANSEDYLNDTTIMKSAIFLPLHINEQHLGIWTLQSTKVDLFDTHLTNLLESATSYLSIAISNSLSHQKIIELRDKVEDEKQQVEYLANHDGLTNLPNRRQLLNIIETNIKNTPLISFFLVYIDLNNFKPINDTYGHAIGDKVLIEFGRRAQALMHNRNFCARIGGDEFVLFFTPSNELPNIEQLINHINKEINHPFHIHDLYLPLSASLGIAQYPKDGKSSDTLLHFADKNMYSNKYRKIS